MENSIVEIGGIYLVILLCSIIISIVVFMRWWKMTAHIKDIRDYLYKNEKTEKESSVIYTEEEYASERVEILKSKLKANECIVKLNVTNKIEVWNKKDWDDSVLEGKEEKFFTLLYDNFDK
jgi:hypothetical protein